MLEKSLYHASKSIYLLYLSLIFCYNFFYCKLHNVLFFYSMLVFYHWHSMLETYNNIFKKYFYFWLVILITKDIAHIRCTNYYLTNDVYIPNLEFEKLCLNNYVLRFSLISSKEKVI